MSLKVILLASKDLGVLTLEALLHKHELAVVVGAVPGDEGFESFATVAGVNILKVKDINSEHFLSDVRNLKADLLINVIFLQRYRSQILGIPKFGAINVHPSKLPYYRGRDCIRWAMINGETEIGVTVHQVDEGLDTGEILLQETFPIGLDENYLEVRERMKPYYPKLVLQAIQELKDGKTERKKQRANEGTYFPHRTPEDGRINWADGSLDIHNLVRASYEPGFYAFAYLGERKLYITRTKLRQEDEYGKLRSGGIQRQGRVLDYDNNDETESAFLVGTGDGAISLESCGFEGSERERARVVLKRGDKLN
jgi:methionyl-tRNA formyltransferase